MKDDEYRIARRAYAEARDQGRVKIAVVERGATYLPESHLYVKPRGWRKFFLKVRRISTVNSAMRRIAGTE